MDRGAALLARCFVRFRRLGTITFALLGDDENLEPAVVNDAGHPPRSVLGVLDRVAVPPCADGTSCDSARSEVVLVHGFTIKFVVSRSHTGLL